MNVTRVLALALVWVAACGSPGEQVATPARPPATSAPAAAVIAPTRAPATSPPASAPSPRVEPTASLTAAAVTPVTCEPTPPDQLGPFYVPGAPERSSVGQGHVLRGIVRSSASCAPIAGAQVEFWLAGPDGEYGDDFRATQFADTAGAYRFESHIPVPYTGRPPHIHIRVSAGGFETLVTQYYPSEGSTEGTFDLTLIPAN
jgi:protocatechuate 3,4-dioxygenase beta subunit